LPELLCGRKALSDGTVKFSLGPAVSSSKMYCTCRADAIGEGCLEKEALPLAAEAVRPSYLGGAILLMSESERSESGDRVRAGVREYLKECEEVIVERCGEFDMAREKQACALTVG